MVAWSQDDQFVFTAVTNYSIKMWNANNGLLIYTMKVRPKRLQSCTPVVLYVNINDLIMTVCV